MFPLTKRSGKDVSMVVYIWASLLHLAVESEKKVTVVKPEQIHKMTIFLNQNGPVFSF